MALLLHLSDPHFGTEQPRVVRALVALAHARRPDLLVLSGDITQRAQLPEFEAARAFCRELGIARSLTLPGNHDIPLLDVFARAFRPYARYLSAFGPRLDPSLDLDGFLVLGVNTTRASRHKDGEVAAEQVERVARQLQGARAGQLRIVVTHQPAAVLRKEDERDRLHGADAALQAWSRAGADLVLGGHIHLPYVIEGGTERPLWVVQAGTAVSDRIRHGTCNSVNFIEWKPQPGQGRQCRVERWDFSGDSGAFGLVEERVLRLGN